MSRGDVLEQAAFGIVQHWERGLVCSVFVCLCFDVSVCALSHHGVRWLIMLSQHSEAFIGASSMFLCFVSVCASVSP